MEDFVGFAKFSIAKQNKIIPACMTLHNFIRERVISDSNFDLCDWYENYISTAKTSTSQPCVQNSNLGERDSNINAFPDEIAGGLINTSQDNVIHLLSSMYYGHEI